MTNVQRQRELRERIADDERHAATAHKAAMYDDLLARAERAETERDELRERNDILLAARADLMIEANIRLAQMYAAEKRVAELEEEARWRPGTEAPPAPDWYQTAEWNNADSCDHRYYDGAEWEGLLGHPPNYWRFIAPLPDATTKLP